MGRDGAKRGIAAYAARGALASRVAARVRSVVADAILRALGGASAAPEGASHTLAPTPTVTLTRISWRSLASRIVERLIPLTGMKWINRSEAALLRRVATARPTEPALPPSRMRRRCRVTETWESGSRVFTVAPRGKSGGHVLYLHGGAYVLNIVSLQWSLVERLIERAGCTVTVPLYPLAPEHDYRAAFDVVQALYERRAAEVGADRLTVLGDSAGGGMALALAQALRDGGRPLPAGLVLISPWLDATASDPSQPALARRDRMLDLPGIRAAGRWYAGGLSPRDPRISPLFGSLADLPPILAFTGTHDVLNADARRLALKAARQGARLDVHEYAGQLHDWPLVDLPESRQVLAEIARFMQTTGSNRPP